MVRSVRACAGALLLCSSALALYEDQIGQFDWYRDQVGKIQWACYAPALRSFVVATEGNAVATIDTLGKIGWRHVFDSKEAIDAFDCDDSAVVTVSGHGSHVRAWDMKTGEMLWQHQAEKESLKGTAGAFIEKGIFAVAADGHVALFGLKEGTPVATKAALNPATRDLIPAQKDGQTVAIARVQGLIDVTVVDIKSGSVARHAGVTGGSYALASSILVYQCGKHLCTLNTETGTTAEFKIFEGYDAVTSVSKTTVGASGAAGSVLLSVSADGALSELKKWKEPSAFAAVPGTDGAEAMRVSYADGKVEQEMLAIQGKAASEVSKYTVALPEGSVHGHAEQAFAGGSKSGVLIVTSDEAAIFVQNGRHAFTREEALANVVSATFVDLPSDREVIALLKEEFNAADKGRPLAMIFDRIKAQVHQLQRFVRKAVEDPMVVTEWLGIGQSDAEGSMTMDEFGLQKVIVAMTSSGKLFGIHSKRGRIVWSKMLGTAENAFEPEGELVLSRSAYHYPHAPQLLVFGTDADTAGTIVYAVNPITGDVARDELAYRVAQLMSLRDADETGARHLLLLDSDEKVHVYPDTPEARTHAASQVKHTYMYTIDGTYGVMRGYKISSGAGGELSAQRSWENVMDPVQDRMVAVAFKPRQDKTKLQFEPVENNDKVLYKYLNPNLVAMATMSPSKTLTVILWDMVTGGVLHRVAHQNAGGPVHIIQFEHSVLYHFWNNEEMRFELVSMDLYENQPIYDRQPFESTLSAGPIVIRQSFIFPATVSTWAVTSTHQGITYKQIIVGLRSGGLFALDRRMVNPKRPINKDKVIPGLMPYSPLLPPAPKQMLNYNLTVHNVRGIVTAPTLIESHGLVFAYGTDLYCTRVIPSGSFDLLSDDFNKPFLIACVLGIVIASYATQKLASDRKLQQKWP